MTTTPTRPDTCTQYAKDVVEGRIPSCRYVKLACQRHLKDLTRKDVWFDVEAGRKFFRFCRKYLHHYKGPMRGQSVTLNAWQKFIFGCVYGWKLVVDGERTDIWRFNTVYLEVPRKNGKTTMCAAVAAYDALMLDETGAEVYCVATKEDQAKILYNDVAAYIAGSNDLSEAFEILKGKNTIFASDSSRTSFIKPLGADSQRQDGLNPITVICDELHQWPKEDLWDVMFESFGARENYHMIAITTAGSNREGICYKKRDAVINILEGDSKDDSFFGIIYTIDDKDRENDDFYKDEKFWFMANPNLGQGKLLRKMQTGCVTAETQASALNPFLNKQLNVWTDAAEAWLSFDLWKSRASFFNFDFLKNKQCTVAIDLSKVNDLSAVAYVFGKQEGLDKIHVHVDFFLPKIGIKERSKQHRVKYEEWEKEKWIKLTPGKTTDYNFIHKSITDHAEIVQVDKIVYDRHFAYELVTNLANDNFVVEPVGMGFLSLGAPTEETERLIIEDELAHNNNPILNWNIRNTVIEMDAAGNKKPSKVLSRSKIDGVMAMVMAISDVSKNIKKTSKYEKEGMTVVGGKGR